MILEKLLAHSKTFARRLPHYRESPVFSEEERLVIELAVEMAGTPVEMPPELL